MFNELASTLEHQKSELLRELFEQHGYDRAALNEAFAENRVLCVVCGNKETYSIDGKQLFTIEKLIQQNDEKHTFTFTFREVTGNDNLS